MNWFIILPLSVFWAMTGLSTAFLQLPSVHDWGYWAVIIVIGLLSVVGFSTGSEVIIWLVLIGLSALLLALFTERRWFGHGLLLGLIGGGIATFLQLTFLAQYSEIYPDGAAWLTKHVPIDIHERMTQIYVAIAVGLTRGVVLGLLTEIFAHFVERRKAQIKPMAEQAITQ
jgi:hypothetical protein